MYNLFAPNTKFKIGKKIKVSPHCGCSSNREGNVINHFEPESGFINYLKRDSNWIPVQYDNGEFDYVAFNFLIVINP